MKAFLRIFLIEPFYDGIMGIILGILSWLALGLFIMLGICVVDGIASFCINK